MLSTQSHSRMPIPGPIAIRAAEDAERNVGVHEVGENSGVYVNTYLESVGLRDSEQPWCMAFVYFRLWAAAGRPADYRLPCGFPRTGYTPLAAQWAKEHELWIPAADARAGRAVVSRGDLCFFYFSAKGRIAHVGMVTGMIPGGVATVEGNTSPGAGIEREGDGVYRKSRRWSAFGRYGGFARIPF